MSTDDTKIQCLQSGGCFARIPVVFEVLIVDLSSGLGRYHQDENVLNGRIRTMPPLEGVTERLTRQRSGFPELTIRYQTRPEGQTF